MKPSCHPLCGGEIHDSLPIRGRLPLAWGLVSVRCRLFALDEVDEGDPSERNEKARHLGHKGLICRAHSCCVDRIRTYDLQVMSLTHYERSPRPYLKYFSIGNLAR